MEPDRFSIQYCFDRFYTNCSELYNLFKTQTTKTIIFLLVVIVVFVGWYLIKADGPSHSRLGTSGIAIIDEKENQNSKVYSPHNIIIPDTKYTTVTVAPSNNPRYKKLIHELHDNKLIDMLRNAMGGYNYNNTSEQLEGLRLFDIVLKGLSIQAKKELDQTLLNAAMRDDSDGRHKEAIDKYRSLFSICFKEQ